MRGNKAETVDVCILHPLVVDCRTITESTSNLSLKYILVLDLVCCVMFALLCNIK